MRLTSYADAGDFVRATRGFLEQQEVINGLILGLAMRLEADPLAYGSRPYLAAVFDAAEPILAALMTPPYNLTVTAAMSLTAPGMAASGQSGEAAGAVVAGRPELAQPAASDQALAALAEDLLADGRPVAGVLGSVPLAEAFAGLWSARARVAARRGLTQRIYELREVTAPGGVPGHLRVANEADAGLVSQWMTAFHAEAMPHTPAPAAAAVARSRIAEGTVFLWDDDGPAAMALRSRATAHGAAVGEVYTPPERRRRGYASACVAALSQRLLDAGFAFCTLFTDLGNPTSNNIYQKIGYRPVCDFAEIKFGPRQAGTDDDRALAANATNDQA